MKCPKCKTPLRKGSKFCPKCGAKAKHTARNLLMIVLAVALLLGGAGAAGWKLGLFQTTGGVADENFTLLSGTFTDRLIVDQESALAAIGDVADILGIEDVNAEFSDCKVDTVSGNTYYRFYQEYEGIPVFGRSIVVAADEYGNSLTLSGNYLNVRNIETTPQIDENSALQYTKQRYGENINVSNGGLKIYSLNNMSPELAWAMYINSDTINESCFISAIGGNVIAQISRSYTDNISYKGVDVDGETLNFNTTTLGALHSLEDEDRNIHVYNAGNETLLFELVSSEGLYGLKLYTHPTGSNEKILTPVAISQFGDWKDACAITSMGRTAMVYDFYDLVLNHIGFANNNAPIYVAYNDYFDGVVEQAMSSWFELENGSPAPVTLLHFGSETSLSIDLIAHEYTHSVEHAISSMVYFGESGALMESYSDILGECIEDWSYLIDDNGEKKYDTNHVMDDSCDWLHNGGTRDLVNPENSTEGNSTPHPRIYQGSNWVDTSNSFDNGGVHINSTVVSHAAYLMNTGIGGSHAFESLSTNDLAHLFYRTLYTLPSDCTFSQFRTLVESTADIMCQQGALTEKQRLCVSNAFSQVGIAPSQAVCYTVSSELSLLIYDVNREQYSDYDVTVSRITVVQGPGITSPLKKVSETYAANEIIHLDEGKTYQITITDKNGNQDSVIYYVNVQASGKNELEIYTSFGEAANDAFPAYLEAAKLTISSGSWIEDLTMTANMTLTSGNSTTKATATVGSTTDIDGYVENDLSSLRMSGSANVAIAGQYYAWNMTYANGVAHYDYTEPTITSADVEIDPSYFDFGSITQDMVSASSFLGNTIKFTVRGDAMTEIGISAVGLMDGIENLSYGDVDVVVTVNTDTGKIDTLSMSFHASMTYQGYDAEVDYVIDYRFLGREAQSDDYVTDAYAKECTYTANVYNEQTGNSEETTLTLSFHIPQINLAGNAVDKVNKEIYNAWYPAIQNVVSEIDEYGRPMTSEGMSYFWMVNGDMLSLVAYNYAFPEFSGGTEYFVYNLSISTGELLTKDEVYPTASFSQVEYRDRVRLVLASEYLQNAEGYIEQCGYDEFFCEQLKKTMSDENITEAIPYINEDGQLCVAARIYSLAAADYYWHLVNLEQFTLSPYYSEAIQSMGTTTDTDSLWKQAYSNYIRNDLESLSSNDDDELKEFTEYQLIYIDDDNIPELWICYPYMAAGSYLCTFDGANINTIYTGEYGSLSYIEHGGILYTSGGHMDVYWDEMYTLEDGQFVRIARGDYGAEDNSNVQIDENGNPIYQYNWNGTETTEEEYQRELASVFDFSASGSVYNNVSCNYFSILGQLS